MGGGGADIDKTEPVEKPKTTIYWEVQLIYQRLFDKCYQASHFKKSSHLIFPLAIAL